MKIVTFPDEARSEILAALRKTGMHREEAMKLLDCKSLPHFTLWINKLGLSKIISDMDQEAKKDGWHHGKSGGSAYFRNRDQWRRKRAATFRKKKRASKANADGS